MTTEKEISKNIKNKIIFNHAQNVAGLDHLTGALNKSSFEAKLKDLENTEKALVLFIDLDKFKPVNDTYGHKAGDSILEGVAERLMAEFNHPHVVARLGGDEFCLIVYGKDKKDEEKLVKKVEKLVTEPFIVEGVEDEISVGCSIGSAHYPTEGNCGLELNKVADERMYEAKLANGIER
jgi:diguanylate cyclase (GGDEF)-like protein